MLSIQTSQSLSNSHKESNIFDPIHEGLDQHIYKNDTPRHGVIKFIKKTFFGVMGQHYPGSAQYFDLYFTGSLTTYQYNETSDMDISVFPNYYALQHIMGVQTPLDVRKGLIKIVIDEIDGRFVPGTLHPVQNFIVPADTYPQDMYKPGLRSAWDIKNDVWFMAPEKDRVHDVAKELPILYQRAADMSDKMRLMLDHDKIYAKQLFKQIHKKRTLDQQRGLGDFCLAPNTQILTDDNFTWKNAEDLNVGDCLVGFDEYVQVEGTERRGIQRKLRRSLITSKERKYLPSYRIVTDRNGDIIASAAHLWLVRGPKKMVIWKATEELKRGDKIIRFGDVWHESSNSLEASYLAGLFDGEGHITSEGRLGFTQREGLVMERGKEALDALGFKYSSNKSHKWQGLYKNLSHVQVFGSNCDKMRFLNQVPTVRLRQNYPDWWIGRSISAKGKYVDLDNCLSVIESVEFVGEQEVIALGTSTKTLIANGLYSHNSEGNIVYKYLLHEGLFDRLRNELGIYIARRLDNAQEEDKGMEETEIFGSREDSLEGTQETQEHVAANEGDEYDWPDLEDVHDISLKAVENHQGYRDTGLLEGAIGNTQMQQMYGAHEDIFDTAANLIAKLQRQQAIVEGNKRTATATGLTFLDWNGYDTSALAQDGVWEKLVEIVYHISDAVEANEDKYIPMLADMLRKYCKIHKTAAAKNLAEANVKVIYDFEADRIILGTPGQVIPKRSKIVGEYDGSNIHLYSTGQEFVNSNYLKRLWHASFPTRPLNNIYFDGEPLKLRQASEYEMELAGHIKYPRTYHLPWSPGATSDDKILQSTDQFLGQEVVVTEKLDGENTTIYRDGIHARSLDTKYHPTRTLVNKLQGEIGYQIPEGWRVCGENMQGQHSISYNLPTSFFVFSIWDEHNVCFSWEDTAILAGDLGLHTVPVLWQGTWDEEAIKNLQTDPTFSDEIEGYVVRLANAFPFSEFENSVAKFVREDHVQTDDHWLNNVQYNKISV